MTRRIALALLTLTLVLLTAAAVPLGLSITQREHVAFRDKTQAAARVIASSAEEYLSDHLPPDAMRADLAAAQQAGDCAAVYDAGGQLVASTPCTAAQGPEARELAAESLSGREPEPPEGEGRLLAAEPVGDFRQPGGAVVLARSTAPLDTRIAVTWAWIALIGAGGLAASALVSVWLARWVGRPLTALDTAAQRLGEGELRERAAVAGGPPEVRRLAATFNTMAARTEALIHGHQAVVADVSHQLRTPLTALRLRLDLLAAAPEGAAPELLASAQEEVARLSRLVDGLLAVARAEQAVPRPVAVRVDEVVRDRAAAWEPVALEHGIHLGSRCRAPGPVALGAGHLEQILDNLLANALDAVAEGGTVTIDSDPAQDTVRVRVVDDGPGMSPEAKAVAFHRFGNPQARGSGLGLAIVHRLVTANGGTVRLEDTPGGGLTAVLDLPRWRERRNTPTGGPTAGPETSTSP
ncbi:HAMP domain-containing histidine kinase [Kitasatospora sp. NBC_01560]|uniref:sensor histidine kinase n=1 Tax=Kitasatospora sp. NBC_01560 TaxID=2975965 RepID=UPI0038655205